MEKSEEEWREEDTGGDTLPNPQNGTCGRRRGRRRGSCQPELEIALSSRVYQIALPSPELEIALPSPPPEIARHLRTAARQMQRLLPELQPHLVEEVGEALGEEAPAVESRRG